MDFNGVGAPLWKEIELSDQRRHAWKAAAQRDD